MNDPAFLEPVTLPSDGVYTVVVDPNEWRTGTATISLFDVVHVTGNIVPNGATVGIDLLIPGQQALLEFAGVAGQKISVTVTTTTGDLGCSWYIRLQQGVATRRG